MTAAERKVKKLWPCAVCFKVRGEARHRVHPARWQQGRTLGSGETKAEAWKDAASRLTGNPE